MIGWLLHHLGTWAWLTTTAAGAVAKWVAGRDSPAAPDSRASLTIDLGDAGGPLPGDLVALMIRPPSGASRGWREPSVLAGPGWTRWTGPDGELAFWRISLPGDPVTVTLTGCGEFAVAPMLIPDGWWPAAITQARRMHPPLDPPYGGYWDRE